MNNFVKKFETTAKRLWDRPAVTGYTTGEDYTYGQLVAEIMSVVHLWEKAGLQHNDKVAINAKSSVNWIKVRMASCCGGYTSVELLPGFLPSDIQAMTVHSEARLLYTEKANFAKMDFAAMPHLIAAIDLNTGELLASRGDFASIYAAKTVEQLDRDSWCLPEQDIDRVCDIMYTSGSTGNPKGVMLSIRNLGANEYIIPKRMFFEEGANYLSILPYAHIFGLIIEITIPLCNGMHLFVLGQQPAPTILKKAFADVKPIMYFSVPLVLLKLIDSVIGDEINTPEGKRKLDDSENNKEFCQSLHDRMMAAMGGNIKQIFTGAAAIPYEVEELIVNKLKMPMITGYGMTEVGGMLSNGYVKSYTMHSVGEVMANLGIRIDSEDPLSIPGELQVKGDQVFSGYFHNPEATANAFTYDGWYRTGDVGIINMDRTIFLSGRCKSMLLGTNGQNIYPEEIEVKLNVLPYVQESIIVQRNENFIALIYPNLDAINGAQLSEENVANIMKQNIKDLNNVIPAYASVSSYELMDEPFAKTPKGSIKRFLYK